MAQRIVLSPSPPYNFPLSMRIFEGGDPQIRAYGNGRFRQVIRLQGGPAVLEVTAGTDGEGLLAEVTPAGARTLSTEEVATAEQIVIRILSLGVDLAAFYRDVRNDPVISRLTRLLRGLRSPTTETVFEALVASVIEQQISLSAARAIQQRLVRLCGDPIDIGDTRYFGFPTPENLAAAGADAIRGSGLSQRKAEYVHGIASRIGKGDLDLENLGEGRGTGEIIDLLTGIRGIGPWTAELTLVRGMQRFDAFPADDLGLRRHIGRFYGGGGVVKPEEARMIAERWGRWKGLAGYYLIVADSLGLGPES